MFTLCVSISIPTVLSLVTHRYQNVDVVVGTAHDDPSSSVIENDEESNDEDEAGPSTKHKRPAA